MRLFRYLSVLTLGLVAPVVLHATPVIHVTETATFTASGSLDGTSFTNALVTLTGKGYDDDIDVILGGEVDRAYLNFTVTVAGVGTETLTDNIATTLNRDATLLGITNISDNTSLITYSGDTWANKSLFSSFTTAGGGDYSTTGGSATTNGDLLLTSVSNGHFTSQFGNDPIVSDTPEPSSLMLLGTGSLGVVGAVRRRFKK